jgi:hypothetical protein
MDALVEMGRGYWAGSISYNDPFLFQNGRKEYF